MTDIAFCHLLNDASGSPRVLRSVIKALGDDYRCAKLFIGSDGRGVLEECGIPISRYWYYRTRIKYITLLSLLLSQLLLFIALVRDRSLKRDAIIYVNTLLPFGAAVYGKMTGRKVIYHIHEISIEPKMLRYILCLIVRMTSSTNIYVSNAHELALPIAGVPTVKIYNALDEDFGTVAYGSVYQHRRDGIFSVLMIASLRDYKGVPELLSLVHTLEHQKDIRFVLVVNDDKDDIDRYFSGRSCPAQLTVHPRTNNTAVFYRNASLVLNLSNRDAWIETFGMTVLEAMAFAIPVIVPPVGGPAELVDNAIEGFIIDSRNTALLREKVLELAGNPDLCNTMSVSARERSRKYSIQIFAAKIHKVISGE